MRDRVISPRFDAKAPYKGQDIVHYGVRIPLHGHWNAQALLDNFSRSVRRTIAKGWPADLQWRIMTNEDLGPLRALWFDPSDPTFPSEMGDHIGITAVTSLAGEIVGGILLKPEGRSLFLHQLVCSAWAKKQGVPTLLVWEMVQWILTHENGVWWSLDVGVSYNPKRMQFFNCWRVEKYPIILKRPEQVPVIRLSPFKGFNDRKFKADRHDWKKNNATFMARGAHALEAALRLEGVGKGDYVTIVKTFGSEYISACVTDTIEKLGARWELRRVVNGMPKAVIAVHEFGLPVFQPDDMKLLTELNDAKVPVIEDCAWRSAPVWTWSKYQVFSLSKISNLNYGGILRGAYIDDETLWSWGILDFVKRDTVAFEAEQDEGVAIRERRWKQYHHYVLADGMTPDDCLDYEDAIMDGWAPTVYLQRFKDDAEADAIVQRLEDFGIQAGHYWGEPVVFLPIHQSMSEGDVEYMFAVVRGYFNSCRDWGSTINAGGTS